MGDQLPEIWLEADNWKGFILPGPTLAPRWVSLIWNIHWDGSNPNQNIIDFQIAAISQYKYGWE